MPDRLPTFQLLGVRPIVVEELGREAILLVEDGLVLIDAGADIERVAEWALATAAHDLADTSGPRR